ncbi:MAG: RsmE family RNA methyltransferase [Candidatus Omnitrophota bacterium]
MSKVRIYISPRHIDREIKINDIETIHKLTDVLRKEKSDTIYVFDGQGKEYSFKIYHISKRTITIAEKKLLRTQVLSKPSVTLGLPLVKERKFEFILEKAAELGVDVFRPFICQRSLKFTPGPSKIKRWKRVILESSRQSGRLWIPEIMDVIGLKELAAVVFPLKFTATLNLGKNISSFLKNTGDSLIVVGPEGDFSDSEYKMLSGNNFVPWNISSNILRTETAAISAVAVLKYFRENNES